MTIDRTRFFATVRARPFGGRLRRGQVQGLEWLLDAGEARGVVDERQLAYVLGTAFHETAATMRPIREIGCGRGRAYGKRDPQTGKTYYGRGYVQITWKANYARLGERLGVDLVAEPDRALEPGIAAAILYEGMTQGLFTGRRLAEFFDGARADWEGARRIVNGTDRAGLVADHARAFHAALVASRRPGARPAAAPPIPAPPIPAPPIPAPPKPDASAGPVRRLFAALATLFTSRREP